MEKRFDVWVVVTKEAGEPVEGMITGEMSPALRDFYNRSEHYRVVQGEIVFHYSNAQGEATPLPPIE